MCIIHEYIQQAYQQTLGYTPDYDEMSWRLDSDYPYVNTHTLFETAQLTAVMETMPERLDTDAVAARIHVPVIFRADTHYRNGAVMASFTGDAEVNELEHPMRRITVRLWMMLSSGSEKR